MADERIPAVWLAYADAKRRGEQEEADRLLDQHDADERAAFVTYLREQGHDVVAGRHLATLRELDTGRLSARNTWHALSTTQRYALHECKSHGARFDRVGKEYRHPGRHQPRIPIHAATIRCLCARDLLAWDGGAFDPEVAAVLTERGRFVAQWGPTTPEES